MAKSFIPIVPWQAPAPAVPQPELAGPAETLQRVLHGLEAVVDRHGVSLVERRWIRSLRLAEGEADLTLSLSPCNGEGRELMERSFGVLRGLLPDTDVYVHHA